MSVINQNGLLGIASITSSGSAIQLFNSSGAAGSLTIGTGTTITSSAISVNGNNIPTEGGLSNRNMIINGSMVVNQRGFTGAAGTSTSLSYGVDRFILEHSQDGVVSAGQTTLTSTTGGNAYADGFQNAHILRITTADSSLAAGQYLTIAQTIEGYNVQGIKKGTANAQPVTLSFWCRSTTTGTYIIELTDHTNIRQVSQAYTINAANTWEKKTLTFPADTSASGVLPNDNSKVMSVAWWLAAGSSLSSGTLNTSWAAITAANRAAGQVNAIGSVGDFWLTGVQLEVGSVATPFERRSYVQELALCQRYCYVMKAFDSGQAYMRFPTGYTASTSQAVTNIFFPVEMRITPTSITANINWAEILNNAPTTPTGQSVILTSDGSSRNQASIIFTANSGAFTGSGALSCVRINNTTTWSLAFNSEL